MSKVQRLNLELQSLDEENLRIQEEIGSIKKSLQIIDEDIIREANKNNISMLFTGIRYFSH